MGPFVCVRTSPWPPPPLPMPRPDTGVWPFYTWPAASSVKRCAYGQDGWTGPAVPHSPAQPCAAPCSPAQPRKARAAPCSPMQPRTARRCPVQPRAAPRGLRALINLACRPCHARCARRDLPLTPWFGNYTATKRLCEEVATGAAPGAYNASGPYFLWTEAGGAYHGVGARAVWGLQ